MEYSTDLVEGIFGRRVNRYAAECRMDGRTAYVHVPNSGRLTELLTPGAECLLDPATNTSRKTSHDLCLVRYRRRWVGVDSRLPPRLLAEALEADLLPTWRGMRVVGREPAFGQGRLDLVVSSDDGEWLVETKSVNLVVGGTAYFPDAPTLRGARHLAEMAEAAARGNRRLAVWFVIQRADADTIRPHWLRDPAFAEALVIAHEAGVRVGACRCRASRQGLWVTDEIPVDLTRPLVHPMRPTHRDIVPAWREEETLDR